MADAREIINDPDFKMLGIPEGIQVLKELDPDFAALPEQDQNQVYIRIVGGDVSKKAREEQQRTNVILGAQMAGTAAGTALGGMAGFPTVGAVIGSAGTEYLLQNFGLLPESESQIGVAAATPLIPGGGQIAVRQLMKRLPVKAAIKTGAIRQTQGVAETLKPTTPAKQLFSEARTAGIGNLTKLPKTEEVLNNVDVQGKLGFKRAFSGIRDVISQLEEAATRPGGVATEELEIKISQMGERIQALSRKGGLGESAVRRLRASLIDDFGNLEVNAPSAKASKIFARARKTFKRERAVEELDQMIFSEEKALSGRSELTEINGATLLNKLNRLSNPRSKQFDQLFVDGLGDDLPKVRKLFEEINNLGPLEPKPTLVARGIFAKIGASVAGTPGRIAGARGPEILSRIILSPQGRSLLLGTMKVANSKVITPTILQTVVAAMRTFPETEDPTLNPVQSPSNRNPTGIFPNFTQ